MLTQLFSSTPKAKHIPLNLPQFKNEPTLIITAGTQSGSISLAHDGLLEKIKFARIPRPRYSDNEGFFVRNARVIGRLVGGIRMGSGSTREDNHKEEIRHLFLKDIEATLKDQEQIALQTKTPISGIYLFCPHYIREELIKHIPTSLKNKLINSYDGNYVNNHNPLQLLTIVQENNLKKADAGGKIHLKPSAQKILERTARMR
ncbi:MAG: hypothetical protein COU11_00210 [Candidatus Harrisonbacteria bacterium CG10_big_fil_rev_8_21_14_0_10_49_15]|uniref:Uncharacterized protein n=1 Tax=Candidatus Harrisonbacteria bacterium CG10_big_fil_rev_8_21_14_0_10_49_15 TaxID=1974587 RepID=A0A2H0UM14_9BACT|nr:MAG: hypothetical protein COU11_00210 [Candidatus Harrisonbacteria bacterium CG10_big_fil_rev_8_21_14_0_10_49_15]